MYQDFFGIDIGKDEFAVAQQGSHQVSFYQNTKNGYQDFFETLKHKKSKSFITLETTGGYELALLTYLQNKKVAVHRANTRQVKAFIRSIGKLGKSDSIDAIGLSQYGFERHRQLALYEAPTKQEKQLLKLSLRRSELKKMLVQEKNRLNAPDSSLLKQSLKRVIKAIENEVILIEKQLESIVKSDEVVQGKIKVLKSVDGIGEVTAIALIALLPELGFLDKKQVASLAGLAPHPYESGKKIGYRKTRGGRENVKPVLFMSAMAASQSSGLMGVFYRRLTQENGKKKMVALTALMRKIIVVANARMKEHFLQKQIALAK